MKEFNILWQNDKLLKKKAYTSNFCIPENQTRPAGPPIPELTHKRPAPKPELHPVLPHPVSAKTGVRDIIKARSCPLGTAGSNMENHKKHRIRIINA